MNTNSTTRRAMLGAVACAPLFTPADVPASASEGDAHILAAWDIRQTALEMIEARGTFYKMETHSPAESDAYDMAETRIANANATTPRGLLAKTWVAWAQIEDAFTPEKMELKEHIHRADFAWLSRIGGDLDYEHTNMLSLVRSLRAMTGEA